jgi:large subunit ribosomal protein L29
MKNTKELKQLTLDELKTELLSLRKEQFTLRMKKATGALGKTHLVTEMRRTIARVKTIMTEKAGLSHVKD